MATGGVNEQIAVVTGSSSGIGRAIALALAKAGSALALVGRDKERLAAVAAEARESSKRVEVYQVDLGCDEEIRELAAGVQKDFGAVDMLVHCAGAFRMGLIGQAPLADLDALYRINVRAPYALTQAFLPSLCRRRGQVVFINSSVGLAARREVAAYAATKHALKAIADSLRAEVNADGVRVVTLYPGRTATPQQQKIHELENKPYRPEWLLQPEDIARAVVDAMSLPRTAEVTDINIRAMQKC
jgi:short-subunit dehydrogenase